jgi:protein involved in polysaccharide export with SLBB domain
MNKAIGEIYKAIGTMTSRVALGLMEAVAGNFSFRAPAFRKSVFAIALAIGASTALLAVCPAFPAEETSGEPAASAVVGEPGALGVAAGEQPAASATVTGETPDSPEQDSYRLGAGDRLRIRFFDRFDRDDLNGEYLIGEAGRLRLPRIGSFDAQGKSVAQLERGIRSIVESKGEKLGYFSIEIAQYRPYFVTGLANHPGSYPFVPGFTILHAVSVAGGLYRSPASQATDAIRERRTLSETLDRLAELIARRARLIAERDGSAVIAMPKELAQLEPMRASQMIEGEMNLLHRFREITQRERTAWQSIIAQTKSEADNYRGEAERIVGRIAEQTSIYNELKKLHDDRIINQQRFFEAVAALDAIRRDKQNATAGLARAGSDLEKAEKELAMLTLSSNARIVKEIGETEREINRLQNAAAETRRLISALDALTGTNGSGETVSYKIMRQDKNGQVSFISATETTPVMPGDVIQINSQPEPSKVYAAISIQ